MNEVGTVLRSRLSNAATLVDCSLCPPSCYLVLGTISPQLILGLLPSPQTSVLPPDPPLLLLELPMDRLLPLA